MSKTRHLLHRDGRYYARIVVPQELRKTVGKTELREPLGADRREALRKLPAAAARLLDEIDQARKQVVLNSAPEQVARRYYELALREDEGVRFQPVSDDTIIQKLLGPAVRDEVLKKVNREVGAGSAAAGEPILDWMIANGNAHLTKGTPEYRRAAIAVLRAHRDVIKRQIERDGGEFGGKPSDPILVENQDSSALVQAQPKSRAERVLNGDSLKPLSELLPIMHEERNRIRPNTAKEHRVAVRMLEEFLGGAKPICDVGRQDIIDFKRALIKTPNRYVMRFPGLSLPEAIEANQKRVQPFPTLDPSTIEDKWLAHIRSIFRWCFNNGIIPDDPASGIHVEAGVSKEPTRFPFTPSDLTRLFGSSLFVPRGEYGSRQWALLIALFTGARSSSEIARIALDDIYKEQGVLVFHLIEASKNKRSKRLVPVHQKLIDLGLLDYVAMLRKRGESKLFPDWNPEDKLNRWFLRTYKKQVGVTGSGKVFHSFRNTLKTAAAHAGIPKYLADLITGHADISSAGVYIHEQFVSTIKAMSDALNRIEFESIDWAAIKAPAI